MAGIRVKIGLKCTECGDINYTTTKNPKTQTEKFETKKFGRTVGAGVVSKIIA
jgi:large subunit ribosomal protein L33